MGNALNAAAKKLVEALKKRMEKNEKKKFKKIPVVFVAFDECHTLTTAFSDQDPSSGSRYTILRRRLHEIRLEEVFCFFLSTTAKISQFSGPRHKDNSLRVSDGAYDLIPPFTDLGFDQCMKHQRIRNDGTTTLEEVSTIKLMANFGRPLFGSRLQASGDVNEVLLFAKIKLLGGDTRMKVKDSAANKLACLSRRLPIEFYSTTIITQEAEAEQVASHLRVCVKIHDGFEGMFTISPSEPFLSEDAAILISENSISSASLMKDILTGLSIDKGDRGEFLCMQFLIQARDDVVYSEPRFSESRCNSHTAPLTFSVTEYFKALFHADLTKHLPSRAHPKHRGQTFGDLFAKAKMNFHHFVKTHEFDAATKQYLILAAARSAGLLCANNHLGIDGLMTFTYFDTRLKCDNIGLILWQAKNDRKFTSRLQRHLFDAMDPFAFDLLFPDGETIPIIRIVFSLAAAKNPCLIHRQEEPQDSGSLFTTFDYWCAGIDSKALKPVIKKEQGIWRELLSASQPWRQTYTIPHNPAAVKLRKAANPLAATEAPFRRNWFKFFKKTQSMEDVAEEEEEEEEEV
ncbi:hypothetical protein H0H81_011367 [Sphagnurus paluster]|uniref:Uncharacterized protein n=1 Tax=Sphagnurus paluster TaxID=117069 RepID=A0A9P7GIJ5_9AGAR|nr:hypothetical protein H0H81_011367 [Sphagnurus paluster]